jgi:protein O-GlcNAc transferase
MRAALALREEGRHDKAAEACHAILARDAGRQDALHLLAASCFGLGRQQEGIACLRRICELAPGEAKSHLNLAGILAGTGDAAGAVESYRQALQLQPETPEILNALAVLLKALGSYDEAEAYCSASLRKSASADVRRLLANVWFEQGRVEEAIAGLRSLLETGSDLPAAHSDLLRMSNYVRTDPPALYREHRAWADRHARPLEKAAPSHANTPQRARRLRIGYVSPYFRKHAVTFFLESVIEHHDRDSVEVILYADVAQPDDYSRRLQGYGAAWRKTLDLSDEALAARVREDAVDILVDLSGHTPGNRLLAFARRAAPIQITWNGYPNTTGMESMDYRITDAYCDPPGTTEHLHSEILVCLPHIYMTWRPPDDAPAPGPLPVLTAGAVTFGSFNGCYKITPEVVAVWARILGRVPGSRLVLLTVTGDVAEERLRALFAAQGIAGKRLQIQPRVTHDEFLAAHRQVDIALDAFPYHGTTTTCFSLWMGVPVVALAGTAHASRVGVSMLSNLGLPHLAAGTPDEYVDAAVGLAADTAALSELRATLRDRMLGSPNTDGKACAASLERAYRDTWHRWCDAHE